jgi:hypothetical protein
MVGAAPASSTRLTSASAMPLKEIGHATDVDAKDLADTVDALY